MTGRATRLHPVPMTRDEANAFVASFHDHNDPVAGYRFAIGASDGENLVGVAIVGRPIAIPFNDGFTAEITRVSVPRGVGGNVCSFLHGCCWRTWRAMGGRKLITYTLQSESGASLRGSGAKLVAELKPNKPGQWQNRPGRKWQPVVGQAKFRWEWAV